MNLLPSGDGSPNRFFLVTGPSPLFAAFVVAMLCCFSTEALPANITYDESGILEYVLIEGNIESGDYEKLIDAVLQGGSDIDGVYIASRGGDAIVAMQMGQLIRALKFRTEVPENLPKIIPEFPQGGAFCLPHLPIAKSNCTCASACVLVYLSGVYRFGDYLGIHRAFVNHEYLKNLSMEEAAEYSSRISTLLDSYLTKMGAPSSLLDEMSSIPSDEVKILDRKYVDKHLEGYAKEYQEWVVAKCGNRSEIYKRLQAEKNDAKAKPIHDEYLEVHNCEGELMAAERQKSFYPAITSAIREADISLIPRHSLLESLLGELPFDLSKLIGKSNQEAVDLLSLVGIASPWQPSEISSLKDAIYNISSSLTIGFDTDGTVFTIDIPFYDSVETDKSPYQRHFLKGLNIESSSRDFVKKYGEAAHQGCYSSGVCVGIFSTADADIKVLVEEDSEKLRAISFNRPGYWDAIYDKRD